MQSDKQQDYWNRVAKAKTFTHPLNLTLFGAWVDKDAVIIDYGCGYGRLVKQLCENGFGNVKGFDTSVELVSRGNAIDNLSLEHIATAPDLPVMDGTVDCILLFAVLTCIPSNGEQMALIELLHRKLRPGGVIYLSDYYLQLDKTEVGSYLTLDGDEEAYGVFALPEGAMFRHHTRSWINRLTQHFMIMKEWPEKVSTMNGHDAAAFQMILQKPKE
jgi:SAM-dependent methyltransferase